jgi:CBS domain-containing protein/copper chaperone CopZ
MQATRTVLLIAGMRGAKCRQRVVAALEAVCGVKEVEVNLYRARATVLHAPTCETSGLIRAVVSAGYGAVLDVKGRASRGLRGRLVGQSSTAPSMGVQGASTRTTLKTALTAKDVMVPEPICVEPSTTIRQLAREFEENQISGAPVVDQEGRVIGVVSKTDLIRRCSEGTGEVPPADLFEVLSEQGGEDEDDRGAGSEPLICVQEFMTEDPVTVALDTPVSCIGRIMFERRIHRVVVVDGERFPLGIITSLDLLGVVAHELRERAGGGRGTLARA